MTTLVLIALAVLAAPPADGGAPEGPPARGPIIGRPAPGWGDLDWVRGEPHPWASLEGRVVLVRWWTGPGCPYCRAAAPRLRAWHEKYAGDGLVVVGLYHHKGPGTPVRAEVGHLADMLGFAFPIAIDPGWDTLERWWPAASGREFTSVSVLLDRAGIVRYVHDGGIYGREEAAEMERRIQTLLR